MSAHPSITRERVLPFVRSGVKMGFCVFCGEDAPGIEPDTVAPLSCARCGEFGVLPADQIAGYLDAEFRNSTTTVTAPWRPPRAAGLRVDVWLVLAILAVAWLVGFCAYWGLFDL